MQHTVPFSASKISYWFLIAFCGLMIALGLTTLFFTVLFSLLMLQGLNFKNYRILATLAFFCLVSCIFTGFGYFVNRAVTAIPEIAERAIPELTLAAQAHNINLPFNDLASFNATLVDFLGEELSSIANIASIASKEFVYFLIGILVAVGLFITPTLNVDKKGVFLQNNLYVVLCDNISMRFSNLFLSFRHVMGAQIIIALINTAFTLIFLSLEGLPHFEFLVVTTFICGLFPIIGNIISNTIIFCVAMTISSTTAIHALIFLIILHKFEYFLNSKIIGSKIKNPMWLTLVSLVIGERIMGLPGLILAPIFLNFIKLELSKISAIA